MVVEGGEPGNWSVLHPAGFRWHDCSLQGQRRIQVPDAKLWGVRQPNLYTLHLEVLSGDDVIDDYRQRGHSDGGGRGTACC